MTTTKPRILNYEIDGIDEVLMVGELITLSLEIDKEEDFTLDIELKNIETGKEYSIYAYIRRIIRENGKTKATLRGRIPYYTESGKYKVTKIYVDESYELATYEIEVPDGEVLTIEKF